MRPPTPQIIGPNACAPNTVYNFSVSNPNPGSDYCWEVSSGNIVSSNVNSSSIDVIFDSIQISGNVKCIERDRSDVLSLQRIKGVNISSSVAVAFTNDLENSFRIFPNPADNWVNFELDKEPQGNGLLIFSDFMGRELMAIEVDKKIISIPLQNFASGNYLVRYINGKSIQNRLLIIE
jgi:hypothetical protein